MAAEIRKSEGVLIIKPSGRIIGPAGTELREQITGELENISGAPKVLIDLGDVARIDSSGLGTLVGAIVGCVLIQAGATWLGETKIADTSLVLGAVFVLLVLFIPRGIVPMLGDLWQAARERVAGAGREAR